jgi:hypothetical protein
MSDRPAVEEPMMWADTDPVPDDDDIKRVWKGGGVVEVINDEHQDGL